MAVGRRNRRIPVPIPVERGIGALLVEEFLPAVYPAAAEREGGGARLTPLTSQGPIDRLTVTSGR